jgi:hypothetical protein
MRLQAATYALVLFLSLSRTIHAEEFVLTKSLDRSVPDVYEAAKRVLARMNGRIIEDDALHYVIRARFDMGRRSTQADYAVFSVRPDAEHRGHCLAEIRLGHPPLNSTQMPPQPMQIPKIGGSWVNVRDQGDAKEFFKKLKEELGP